MGSFSIWHWLIVLLVVVLIFGTKKLKNMGSDLGAAGAAGDRCAARRCQHGGRRGQEQVLRGPCAARPH